MSKKICGEIKIEAGQKKICRREHGHGGDCWWSLFRAKSVTSRRLQLVARMSSLIKPLPEGDYTKQVFQVYINKDLVMIEFKTSDPEVLIKNRERGTR